MKVVTIIGARPQFIKAAPVSRALKTEGIDEILVDTGQHYDDNMAAAFVRELGMTPPAHSLGVGSGPHGAMTGRMMERAERVLMEEKPDAVIVYGDTNSTLAGALAAVKLALPVVHVEAGLRSRKSTMPEEINRRAVDHVSTVLCCPTASSVDNLRDEGISPAAATHLRGLEELRGLDLSARPIVVNVGDVMADALLTRQRSNFDLPWPGLDRGQYVLVTLHRAEATDDRDTLAAILVALSGLSAAITVVFPVHPRTAAAVERHRLSIDPRIRCIAPVSHSDFLRLLVNSRALVTDSGGAQKEACILNVPCFTLRDETEWNETVSAGCNVLVGQRPKDLRRRLANLGQAKPLAGDVFGDGQAATRIAVLVRTFLAHASTST